MENTANKAINPCQEQCDFLMSLADLHTKVTWNEIFFGVVTATRLHCPPVGACCCQTPRLSEDLRAWSDPFTAVALLHHASIIYVHLLRWEQTGDWRQAEQLIRYLDGPRTAGWRTMGADWCQGRGVTLLSIYSLLCDNIWKTGRNKAELMSGESEWETLRPTNEGKFQLPCIISFLFFKPWQVRL